MPEKKRKKRIKFVTTKNFIRQNPENLFDDYKFVSHIANGQFGEVYKVKHIKTGQMRCIKVYDKNKIKQSDHNTFEMEIGILTGIDHPNIFKMYEFYQNKEAYYLVTEFLEGKDLFDYITNCVNFTEKTVCVIMEQILSAILYLHKHNIIHRDLKPENIVLAKAGDINSLKLIDFGTCKRLENNVKLQAPLGTRYYMAPEMLLGYYDFKVDVWACGVIMYILMVGYPPFNGNNDTEISQNIVNNPVTFFQGDWENKTPGSINLLMKILTKNPDERIGIDDIFEHNWFKRNFEEIDLEIIPANILSKLKILNGASKLEKAIRIYLVYLFDLREEEKRLMQFFKQADKNHDGMLDFNEIIDICILSNYFLDGKAYLEFADLNEDGKVNYSEFLMTSLDFKKLTNRQLFLDLFKIMDLNNDGYISKSEAIRFFNLNPNSNYIDDLFQEVDTNNDNRLSLDEFVNHLESID